MYRNDASVTAAEIAQRLDQPAFIYAIPPGFGAAYQVACMSWVDFNAYQPEDVPNTVAVVLPNGREFQRLAPSWGQRE